MFYKGFMAELVFGYLLEISANMTIIILLAINNFKHLRKKSYAKDYTERLGLNYPSQFSYCRSLGTCDALLTLTFYR